MKQIVEHFNVIESTSTTLLVELSTNFRLCGQRHSNRYGSSVWETYIEQYGKWKVHDNPFDRKDYSIIEKWGMIKANIFRGVKIAKSWSYKNDIIDALNSIPEKQIISNN